MELKHIRGSKSLKLLFLLLTSLLIASVSASVYFTLYMNATVGVTGNKVQFWAGDDLTQGRVAGSITDARQKITFTSMNGLNGSKTTYTDTVLINNTDTSDHSIELKLGSWTGTGATPMYNITISMYNATTKKGNSVVLVPGGAGQVTTTGNQTINHGTWRVQWELFWKGTATTSDSVNVYLQLMVWS